MVPILHGYWRSGASYRTRIALELKGLAYEYQAVDLRAGHQRSDRFLALNPQGLVPALEVEEGVLTQSPAILEWIDERWPDPPLLPKASFARAEARAMAAAIACDMQPLGNLRVLKYLRGELGLDDAGVNAWAGRWISTGFEALEQQIARHGRGWAFGETATLVDCCLIPQIYSARRFEVDLAPYPRIREIEARAAEHPAFQAAHPDRQPDAG